MYIHFILLSKFCTTLIHLDFLNPTSSFHLCLHTSVAQININLRLSSCSFHAQIPGLSVTGEL